jgi:DNA-binding YbaB/EbfC family protein
MKAKSKPPSPGGKGMFAQVQRMQAELEQAQQELAEQTIEASAGGGGVKVVMTGTQECRAVTIAPELLAGGDVEMLQDLVQLAVNQAVKDSQLLAARRLSPLTGGLSQMGL